MSAAEPTYDALVGRTIGGKFKIESVIGRGGMGAVYRAKQKNLKRVVAIKVLRQELLHDSSYAARFKREANAASQLDHPNLMRVIDFGEDEGLLYIAMEFIDGKPLSVLLREEPALDPLRVVDLTSQLLAALAAMHDANIIHRDLKPENVMIVRGKDDDGNSVDILKLCDFGISKQVGGFSMTPEGMTGVTHTATLTATGALVGTPEYMPPEQAKGEGVDARSDLYSVGVILYQMLTGRLPFKSANSVKVLLAHINEIPAPPSTHVKSVDPALEHLCMKALAKSPDDRYASAREMRSALRDALGLHDSTLIRNRRGAVARSLAPPPESRPGAKHSEPPAATRNESSSRRVDRAAETEVLPTFPSSDGRIARAPSGSGIKTMAERASNVDAYQQTSTPASGTAPGEEVPPSKAPRSAEPTGAPQQSNRAVIVLLGIVIVLLVVIAALVRSK